MAKRKIRHSSREASTTGQINYRESTSDSEINEEDVLEWAEEGNGDEEESNQPLDSSNATDCVEKVLRHRDGVPGATGSATTWYNIQDKGDPNAGVEGVTPSEFERQYLIKWVGWSHLHNTWESDKSLKQMNARGLKKVENYVKKSAEVDDWRRTADKEYIEVYDCEQEMNEELLEQYKDVERIIAHQISREKTEELGEKTSEFLVKWACLPYSECTWEDEGLIRRRFSHKIDEYFQRFNAETIPAKHPALRKRPKFQKLEENPYFLLPVVDGNEIRLRDYQLEGLNWLLHAWCKNNSCILADEMLYGPFLVVVPLSTMAAWQREFELWAPQLNTVVYMGDVNSREQIRQYELSVAGSNRKLRANVVITTYEIVLKDKAFLGHYDWAVLAVDEAHRLKNDESLLYQSLSSFSTNHRLLITGTPLQNSLKELWALLRFIMPERFNDWYEFERAHQDRDHKGISSLHKKLEPFLLRRVKKDVEKSLPAKVEQILRVDMTTQQKQFYKLILTRNYDELSKGVKGSISGFINVMMELKKCCNHCCLVRNDDQMEQEAQARLQQLLKSSGKLILLDKLLCRLKETGHRVLIFSQMVIMLDVLQEYMSLRRFATQRLDGSMRSDLRKQALDHFNAPGSTDFCFLLSTRAGGLGINLATADTVIIFDSDWNPQNDLQAMSRAHRIGQKNQVNIYRLVTKGSVEEEIVERAKKKLVLDHLVIQRMDTTGKTVLAKNAAMNQTSKVPFDKADLTAILKFGAEELFKERLEGDVEPEVDVDDILRRAETRECDPEDNGNELLNSFKYANFAIDEEKDLAFIGPADGETSMDAADAKTVIKTEAEEKDWKDIIPEDQLEAFKEEQRKKAEQEMFLEPRQRQKARETSADGSQDDSENGNTAGRKKTKKKRASGKQRHDSSGEGSSGAESDSDEEETRTGKRTYKKKVIFNFTEKEVRQFTKSFRKFTQPLNRLDAIAQDAELEEHSSAELAELVQEFLRQCQEATVKYESEKLNSENGKSPEDNSIALVKRKHDRGPTFKVGQVDVYVRPIMKMQSDLEPLHKAMEEFKAQLSSTFKIPGKPKRPLGWDVDWAEEDDISLLKGIYQYGMGSWEAIKMDPEFGLADKIWVKNKVKKPQPKHLQSRADCLLKLLAKAYRSSASPPKKRLKGRNESEHGIRSLKDTSLIKKKKSEPNKNSKDKLRTKSSDKHRLKHSDNGGESTEAGAHERGSPSPSKKWRSEDLSQVAALKLNLPRYKNGLKDRTSDEFVKCVDLMRPVHKAIKKMNSEPAHSVLWLKYLTKLGDHITGCVIKLIKEKEAHSSQEEWYNFLWIFLSMFLEADSDPIKLLTTYKHCVKTREKEGSHHHHHSHNSSSHHHNHYDHKSDHPRKTL